MRIFRWECSDALYGFCVNGRIAFIRWHVLHYDTPLPSSSLFITITNTVLLFSHCSLSLCSSISKTPYSLSTSLLLLFPISLDTSYHVSSLSPTIFKPPLFNIFFNISFFQFLTPFTHLTILSFCSFPLFFFLQDPFFTIDFLVNLCISPSLLLLLIYHVSSLSTTIFNIAFFKYLLLFLSYLTPFRHFNI